MTNAIVMSVFIAAALGVFAFLTIPRFRLLLAVRGCSRSDQIGTRFAGMMKFALGQARMKRDPVAGLAHSCIFFGFLVV
ncbi:MAG: hypothetical protein V3T05_02835, partial [Myxococcota bacterium]